MSLFDTEIYAHIAIAEDTVKSLEGPLDEMVILAAKTIRSGGKIMLFGNGGSAADAQHIAAELVGKLSLDRPPIAALALTTDTSALTAIGNDYGFEAVFERQIEALGKRGDLAIGISTSGRSPNVIRGLRAGIVKGMATAVLTGEGHGLGGLADPILVVPSDNTARIQEMHILLGHIFCLALEQELGLA